MSNARSSLKLVPPQPGLSQGIAEQLQQLIYSGDIAPGERLNEAALALRMGTSRGPIREAIRVLVAKGLVLSRQRAGASVRPRSEWHLLDPDVLYWLIQARPAHEFVDTLLTVRRVFEPAAAALAARLASNEALAGIAEAYAQMEAARTADDLLEPDLAFHRRIAEATNNDLLAYIGNMLSLALRESIKLSSKLPNTYALSMPRHKAILAALLARDPVAAHQATLLQLEGTRDDLNIIVETGVGKMP